MLAIVRGLGPHEHIMVGDYFFKAVNFFKFLFETTKFISLTLNSQEAKIYDKIPNPRIPLIP